MSVKFGRTRVKLHERAIAEVVQARGVSRELVGVADDIADDVRQSTSSSRRIKRFGQEMRTEATETGARAGTSWPIAHIIEYGTIRTPAHRIMTRAAERHGRTR